MTNFEKFKQELTPEKLYELLMAKDPCSVCPAQEECDWDSLRSGHPVREEFGGGTSPVITCKESFIDSWANCEYLEDEE